MLVSLIPLAHGSTAFVCVRRECVCSALAWPSKASTAWSTSWSMDRTSATDKELGEIATQVAELSKAVPVGHAVMNNNYEDQGQGNAKTLTKLLKAAPKPVASA